MPPARWRASAWNRSARRVIVRSVPLSARSRRRGDSGTDLPRARVRFGYGFAVTSNSRSGTRIVKVTQPGQGLLSGHRRRPSVSWWSTTSASARAPCAPCTTGPPTSSAIRTGSRARRSTRSGCPKHPDWLETVEVASPAGAPPTRSGRPRSPPSPGARTWRTIDFHPWQVRALRPGPSRRAAHRHRPAARHRFRRGPHGRLRGPRGARASSGITGFAEDLRATGASTSTCGSSRAGTFTEVRLRRDRLRPRGGAAAARPGHHRVVEGGARGAGLHRLQPERPRPDRGQRLLGAGPAAMPRSPRR